MAKNSVPRESAAQEPATQDPTAKLADDRLWIKAQWDELQIPGRARNSLARMDITTYICANLTSLLVDDAIQSLNADDEAGILYRPLSEDRKTGVLLAMQDLLWNSMEIWDSVRNNDKDCWGAKP